MNQNLSSDFIVLSFFFLSFPHLTMQGLSHIKNSFLAPKRKFTIRYLVDFISVWWECVTDMMRY